MELDLQLTPRSRILLGILAGLLLILIVMQVGPVFYRLFANQDTQAKREQLLRTENLVYVAEVLKPIESEIYKETGLALAENPQGTKTLFETELPETVIRSRIDALVRRAGIQQNYQLLTKPGTAKRTQKLTVQNRGNLVLYLYLKHIEAEAMELAEKAEQQAEEDTFNRLMDAWLSGTESDTEEKVSQTEGFMSGSESDTNGKELADAATPTHPMDAAAEWKFASLPEAIPVPVRIQLASFIKSMITQQLRGATDSRQDFFETQLHRVKTAATAGIFGIGAKPATIEIQLQRDSLLLKILKQSAEARHHDAYNRVPPEEDYGDIGELQYALVKYIEEIQAQRATLLEHLALAPLTYQTEHYTVEMKFKTDLEKLVSLNHLIETGAKWLIVRDLRISADKQTTARPEARGRTTEGDTNLNVDMLLIARIF